MADIQISENDELCHLDWQLINHLVQMIDILIYSKKQLHVELLKPLALFFQNSKSLDTSLVPNDWKLADVAPVFKKGDDKLPSIQLQQF